MSAPEIILPESLKEASVLDVFDENGDKVKFSSFYDTRQALVVFIRHFMCSSCMGYVQALSKQIDPSEISARNLNLVIIGCGDPSLIKFYSKETDAKYPIYADPTQNLFKIFGLAKTFKAGKKPDYLPWGFWGGFRVFFSSLSKAGTSALKAGDVTQVGGEFLLGPGNVCTWGHKMTATRDHTEIAELRNVIGLVSERDGTSEE